MVSDDTRAILGTDLAKIGATAFAFFLAYILVPLVYLGVLRIAMAVDVINLSSPSFMTLLTIFVVILIFLLWTVVLFLVVFRGVAALQKKYGTPIKRTDTQEKVRVILIIAGFFVGVVLVFTFYLRPLMGALEVYPAADLLALLAWAFAIISLTEAVVLATILGVIYGLVFLSDCLFHLARRHQNTPLSYPAHDSAHRRFNYLKIVALVLIILVGATAVILYFAHPTVMRLRANPVLVTYQGSAESHTVTVMTLEIYSSTLSADTWAHFDYLESWYNQPFIPTIHALYIFDEVTNFPSKTYQTIIPQGRHVVGFILTIDVDGVVLTAKYYPAADQQSTFCGFFSKWFALESLTILFSGDPTSFSFAITMGDEFRMEDLF